MEIILKNILEKLSDNNIGVTVQMDNCKVCLNNKNVRSEYVYGGGFITDKYLSYNIRVEELVVDEGFIRAVARFIWTYNPRSKRTKPKVIYPEGQLNYEEFEDLVIDLTNFMKCSIDDKELEVWLKCILEKNMILQKWDPKRHVYRPFNSPALKTVLVTRDMKVLIDCAECGKEIEFGVSFTSRLIHTDMGFGYPVCEVCNLKEIQLGKIE